MFRFQLFLMAGLFLTAFSVLGTESALAAILPGPADINRIMPTQPAPTAPPSTAPEQNIQVPSSPLYTTPEPKNAKSIQFVLRGIWFDHVTVFSSQQLKKLYQPYVGKDVTLKIPWQIAPALTEWYRQEVYFLSRAFVPAQDIFKGTLKIQAVEGYIGDVSLTGDAPASSLVSRAVDAIKAERPARMQTLERQLLLLSDLPGVSFQATLEPMQNKDEPSVRLILMARKTKGVTTLGIDKGGSRYLGPYETSAAWSGSLLPLQQTDLSVQWIPAATTAANGNLYAFNATQKMMLSMATSLDVTGGYTNAVPGYTLKPQDITSQSVNGGVGLSYRLVRQRDENLNTSPSMDFRDSDSNILNTVLSRDRIRAVNVGLNYDDTDSWFGNSYPGHNNLDVALRRGLPIFNSNSANDPNASRPDTSPDFLKLTASYNRLQSLARDVSASLTLSGQKSSQSLYSSEEFGYGGMAVGRAYDTSEISGDSGMTGSLEMRYQGLPAINQTTMTPYFFYDIGKVWNYNVGQPEQISAASAGPGMRFQCTSGLSGNFYVARPLTKTASTPLYGGDGTAPRFVFQISDKF